MKRRAVAEEMGCRHSDVDSTLHRHGQTVWPPIDHDNKMHGQHIYFLTHLGLETRRQHAANVAQKAVVASSTIEAWRVYSLIHLQPWH